MSQEAHKQSTTSFVKEQERKSRKTIKDHRESIDALCWEFEYLDDSLARLKNKKECYNLSVYDRNDEMEDITERMTRIINDINFYKECINVEKKEMKRIHNLWGYGYDGYGYDDYGYDNTNSAESEFERPYTEEDEEPEELLKIKYNEVLDIFEDLLQITPPNPQLYYEYIPTTNEFKDD